MSIFRERQGMLELWAQNTSPAFENNRLSSVRAVALDACDEGIAEYLHSVYAYVWVCTGRVSEDERRFICEVIAAEYPSKIEHGEKDPYYAGDEIVGRILIQACKMLDHTFPLDSYSRKEWNKHRERIRKLCYHETQYGKWGRRSSGPTA